MIDFKQLAYEYKTPLYVYDFDYMSEQYEKLKAAFKGRKSILAYAVKANSNLSVCLLYTSPSPRDPHVSRMPSSA